MAAVVDPTAIQFCNNYVRKYADMKARLCQFAVLCEAEWQGKDMNLLIPADGDEIEDGSGTNEDRRTKIDASDVRSLRQRMLDDIATWDNVAQQQTIMKPAVNPELGRR
jgi:hypothetical protein